MKLFNTRTSAAGLSILSNTLLIALKVAVGLMTGSVSVLSEAIHSSLDLAAALIAFLSLRMASRPADAGHPYGHGKIENVSGTAEASLIILAAGLIIYEAGSRIIEGFHVEQVDLGLAVMLISVLVNSGVSRRLFAVARRTDSIALEADAQHLATDVYTSIGVFAGLLAVRVSGWEILDPLVAIGVALVILKAGYKVLTKSFLDLVDVRLPESEEAVVKRSIEEHYGEVIGFHRLRSRRAGRERQIDLHLVMAKDITLEEAHRMSDHLERDIRGKLPYCSVTIHIEPCRTTPTNCATSCPLTRKPPCHPGQLNDE
ncbi:MAG: cation transporter [Chloroflexi bacterium]|nr:cation transporter [Chloroflexota bacterium]